MAATGLAESASTANQRAAKAVGEEGIIPLAPLFQGLYNMGAVGPAQLPCSAASTSGLARAVVVGLARTRQARGPHHHRPPTSISSFAARNFLPLPSSIPLNCQIYPTARLQANSHSTFISHRRFRSQTSDSSEMPPKAAEKKPSTGGKAPAGKTTSEKKEAGKKTAAPSGDKKKRNKTRKETYSSYIYKGTISCSSDSGVAS